MIAVHALKVVALSIVFLVALMSSPHAVSQSSDVNADTLTQQQFIQGCAFYRHTFIDNIVKVLVEFGELSDSLKALSLHPEGHDQFRDRFLQEVLRSEFQGLNQVIENAFPESIEKEKEAKQAYKKWARSNNFQLFQFNFLRANNIIVDEQPYKLSPNADFWHEVQSYNLKAGQTFVDVGAGIGVVSIILASTGFPLQIYMTEVSDVYFDFLVPQFELPAYKDKLQHLHLDTAQAKNLGLDPSLKADRILMREVFHHVNHQEEILASVKQHLKEDGMLILVEATKELNVGNKSGCRKAMPIDKILEILDENGFELKHKKIIGNSYIMQFIPT